MGAAPLGGVAGPVAATAGGPKGTPARPTKDGGAKGQLFRADNLGIISEG